MTIRQETVRGLYDAYVQGRKDIVRDMLSDDFTFSSPRDDHIGRHEYFDRCWPEPPPFRGMEIEFLAIDGEEAVVRYRAAKHDGSAFRNMETLRFKNGKLAAVEVYFGREA
ncbi:nuclear transport factor 2 family protein [Rhizobium sullae]|uniref:Nuclear transport factor 2 family protein n=1 Tax=Rhizobium sullae TaxID=50338 RepID=A0A2N0D2I0_RHISU|nr:nuclear transport factor 2 family protein [Rhizobium sullae]PKA40267.1 nuclear transport factor 2 family protein [Rhizobium sullae]UWU15067.1 nuclear transport factor 2 family protein [Rhizobium sullae]